MGKPPDDLGEKEEGRGGGEKKVMGFECTRMRHAAGEATKEIGNGTHSMHMKHITTLLRFLFFLLSLAFRRHVSIECQQETIGTIHTVS